MADGGFSAILIQAAISAAASYAIARATAPDLPNTEGPRLNDKRVQNSVYGASIPLIFGTFRTAGTVVWGTDFEEEAVTSSGGGGGKGGPSGGTNTEYNYYANFAVQLCEGEITGIRRVWADGRLIYNPVFSALTLPFARVYAGTQTQMPDPLIEAKEGVGNAPAYRGTAYVVFEHWALQDFGNRLPNLTFEIERSNVPTLGALGSPASPMIGSLTLAEQSAPPMLVPPALPAAQTEGSALYVAGTGGLSIAVAQIGNVNNTGEMGFALATHMINATGTSGTWTPGGSFRYSMRGGIDAPATIYPGQSRYRRLIYEQTIAGEQRIVSVMLGSAGTTSAYRPLESFEIPVLLVGAGDLTNFSLWAATAADRIRAVSALGSAGSVHTYIIAASHAANKGGIIRSRIGLGQAATYVYDFRPMWAAGERLHDACHDNGMWLTAEELSNGAFVLRRFNNAFNLLSTSPLPTGLQFGAASSWRISRRGVFTYALALPSGELLMELSGRWVSLGALSAQDASAFHHGQGRGYSYEIFRPDAAAATGWVLSRYTLAPPAIFTNLPGLGGGYPLKDIIAELCAKAGVASTSMDVSQITQQVRGYMVPRAMTARAAIEGIIAPHFVAGVESDGVLKWQPLAQPVLMDIASEDLDARVQGAAPKAMMQLTRMQEVELPQRITLIYANFNGPLYDYQEAEVHAQRLTTPSVQEDRQDWSISFKGVEAQAIADAQLRRAWVNRTKVEFDTPLGSRTAAYTLLEPGDVVTCRGYTLRILEKQEALGLIHWIAVVDEPSIYPLISAIGGIEIEVTEPPDEANESTDGATSDTSVDDADDGGVGGGGGGGGQPDDAGIDDAVGPDDSNPSDTSGNADDNSGPDDADDGAGPDG